MPNPDQIRQPASADACNCGGTCSRCRMRALARPRRRYLFTPELLAELRRAYCGGKRQVSEALDRLQRKTGWPRHVLSEEASRRGWSVNAFRRRLPGEESARLSTGYSVADLQRLFGEAEHKIQAWLRRGLLVGAREGELVSSRAVTRFLHKHPHEYDLRRVDQAWWKWAFWGDLAGAGDTVGEGQ